MNRMLKICAALVLGALVLPLPAGAEDNPLKRAKVGEWVEFVTTSTTMGSKMDMKMKQTVVAKDDISVTLRTLTTMMGKELPPQDTKIMLNQPYQPYTQGFSDAVVTPLGEGNETISVGGKSYACRWAKVNVVANTPAAVKSTSKVWSSKDVPVSGLVKMESETVMTVGGNTMNTTMTMQLTGSGK
jgi:predicted NodU family carbamoyl transferase